MSQSVWGYWMIALGIGVLTIMMLVQNYTTINQEDYYLLKEVTQASMYDAIDYNHYRQYGELKINREKFIENFERRFSESVKGNKNYKTDFYSIYETPPKVSVRVTTKTGSYEVSGNAMNLDVTNDIDAILENNSTHTITRIFYSTPFQRCPEEEQDYLGYCQIANKASLASANITDAIIKILKEDYGIPTVDASGIKIISAKYLKPMSGSDFQKYVETYQETYGKSYESVRNRVPKPGEEGIQNYDYYDNSMADELLDVKLTVTKDNILAWSGKFKCQKNGFKDENITVVNPIDSSNPEHLKDQCLLGIKYELKFSY